MSQSDRNIFRDSRKNIAPYYSQNIQLKTIHYTCCLNLSSVGKHLKKSMRQVLALRQSRYFLNICDYFKNHVKSTEIQFNISSVRPKYLRNSSKTYGKYRKLTEGKNILCTNREIMHLCQVNKIEQYINFVPRSVCLCITFLVNVSPPKPLNVKLQTL